MDTNLALALYLGAGFAHWSWGGPAKDLKNIISEFEQDKSEGQEAGLLFHLRLLVMKFVVFAACLSLYPLFYLIKLYDFFFFSPRAIHSSGRKKLYEPGKLYFWCTGGVGTLRC